MSKPIIVEYKDGRQYGVETEAIARRVHPDAKVISHQDGSPIEAKKTQAKVEPVTAKPAETTKDS